MQRFYWARVEKTKGLNRWGFLSLTVLPVYHSSQNWMMTKTFSMMDKIFMFLLIDIFKTWDYQNHHWISSDQFFSLTSNQFASLVLRPQFNFYIFNDEMVKMLTWNVLVMNNIIMFLFIFRHLQSWVYPNHHRMKSVWTKLGEDDIDSVDEKVRIRCHHLLTFILRSIKNIRLIYIYLTSRNFLATRCMLLIRTFAACWYQGARDDRVHHQVGALSVQVQTGEAALEPVPGLDLLRQGRHYVFRRTSCHISETVNVMVKGNN